MLALSVGILMIIACLGMLSLQLATGVSLSKSAATVSPDLDRTGKIVLQGGSGQCKQMKFDNQNGRISDGATPCDDQIALDARGVPIPQGTIHRLDAISKSFSSH
jgi:hypothetical protein